MADDKNNIQKTIKKKVSIEGIGLHTGKHVNLTFAPSLPNSGVVFKRVDLPDKPIIRADISKVISADKRLRRTSVGNNGFEVHTIEHVMSALSALQIDNVLIEIDNEELPGLDGSTLPFVDILNKSGFKKQDVSKKKFSIKSPIWVKEDDAVVIGLPDSDFTISYTLDYNKSYVPSQYISYKISDNNFMEDIAKSRTFCLKDEVDILKKMGLGKGADYKNTVVIGEEGLIDNNFRANNEFAKHKILDLIGDLYLLGAHIKGHIIAIKSGHSLNIKFLKKLRRQQQRTQRGAISSPGVLSEGEELDVNAIHKILPHRYPFLLVDRIIKLEDKKAIGIKNVTINENFFQGHFPGKPVMPGVLIVEAMAQVAGVLMLSKAENRDKMAYFMSINKVKFRKTVLPGDQLRLEVDIIKVKTKTGQVHTKALVENKVVAEANLMFALVEG